MQKIDLENKQNIEKNENERISLEKKKMEEDEEEKAR